MISSVAYRYRIVAVLSAVLLQVSFAAADPAWWSNVVDETIHPADYAPALLGQMKWFATNAYDELQSHLPDGAGTNVEDLIEGFSFTNNHIVLNIGQLKYVAAKFYDRLVEEHFTNGYPWTSTTTDDVDDAVCTIGQVKYVFDFDVGTDSDSDDLPDSWETHNFGSITNEIGSGDYETDSLSNSNEYLNSTCPTNSDTDADGSSDHLELNLGTDPTDAASHPANVSGTISYSGSQTGLIWVVAVTNSSSWATNYNDVIATPTAYLVTNVLNQASYWLKAYRDSNSNESHDVSEAWGVYTNSPVHLTNDVAGINIQIDDDSDGDGLWDWVETGTSNYVNQYNTGSCATNSDSDGDGTSDGDEVDARTDPNNADTNSPGVVIGFPANNYQLIWLP